MLHDVNLRKKSFKLKEKVVKIGDEISINSTNHDDVSIDSSNRGVVLGEVVEMIELPAFCSKTVASKENSHYIKLDLEVMVELREHVCAISNRYKENRKSLKAFECNT